MARGPGPNVCLALAEVSDQRGCDLIGDLTADRRRRRAPGNFTRSYRIAGLRAAPGWRLTWGAGLACRICRASVSGSTGGQSRASMPAAETELFVHGCGTHMDDARTGDVQP